MSGTTRDERLGIAAATASAILFGSSYVATAFVLRSFTPLSTALWRGVLATVAMSAIILLAERRGGVPDASRAPRPARPILARLWRLGVLGLLGGAVFIVAINLAVEVSGAAIASFVAGLYAVSAAVLAPALLGERLGRGPLAGFAVALAGTLLLAELQPSSASVGGIAAGLVAALSYGLYLVLSRRWSEPWGLASTRVSLSTFVCTAIVLLPIELVREPAAIVPASVRIDALLALAWLVLPVSAGAGLLVVVAVRRIDARRSSAFLLFNPPAAVVAAWLLLGESLRPIQLLGGALVLLGIAIASGLFDSWLGDRAGRRRAAEPAGNPGVAPGRAVPRSGREVAGHVEEHVGRRG